MITLVTREHSNIRYNKNLNIVLILSKTKILRNAIKTVLCFDLTTDLLYQKLYCNFHIITQNLNNNKTAHS